MSQQLLQDIIQLRYKIRIFGAILCIFGNWQNIDIMKQSRYMKWNGKYLSVLFESHYTIFCNVFTFWIFKTYFEWAIKDYKPRSLNYNAETGNVILHISYHISTLLRKEWTLTMKMTMITETFQFIHLDFYT